VVLRSYDTRLRQTSRSPDLYLDAKVKKTYGEVPEKELMQKEFGKVPNEELMQQDDLPTLGRSILYLAKKSFEAKDPVVRNFGYTSDIQQIAEETQQYWLWDNYGKLQLIETAFLEPKQLNVHEAQRPGDFIPIINHLLHLHEQGFVHGDIRAFNMVFNGNDGKLIDFDLSGKVGERQYPLGYKSELPDAFRCGHSLNLIEKHHDWYALGSVIFTFHKFRESANIGQHDFQEPANLGQHDKLLLEIKKISDRFDYLESVMVSSEALVLLEDGIRSMVRDLKKVLNQLDSEKWTCKAAKGLYFYYHRNNIKGIDPATGSPIMVKNNSRI
jgi:serine/threonine protein kinase